ncbi:hypothetical protein SLG_00250 [Sphingobium sp. SYK-6]|nr:hypothetical protein SLG_00250 [Sphingobium sp. SYK-6]
MHGRTLPYATAGAADTPEVPATRRIGKPDRRARGRGHTPSVRLTGPTNPRRARRRIVREKAVKPHRCE